MRMRRLPRAGARSALGVAALIARVLAVALCVLVVVDSLDLGALHTALLGVNGLAARVIPQPILGILVFPTSLGGAFRGDFALVSVLLFVIDWLLARATYRM